MPNPDFGAGAQPCRTAIEKGDTNTRLHPLSSLCTPLPRNPRPRPSERNKAGLAGSLALRVTSRRGEPRPAPRMDRRRARAVESSRCRGGAGAAAGRKSRSLRRPRLWRSRSTRCCRPRCSSSTPSRCCTRTASCAGVSQSVSQATPLRMRPADEPPPRCVSCFWAGVR